MKSPTRHQLSEMPLWRLLVALSDAEQAAGPASSTVRALAADFNAVSKPIPLLSQAARRCSMIADVPNGKHPAKTLTGFFDLAENAAPMWAALRSINSMSTSNQPKGVYLTMNPVVPDLLARANNRLKECGKTRISAMDVDVLRRQRVVIDVDPKRIAGVCATEEERAAARAVLDSVLADLASRGWPIPMIVDSGSGFHSGFAIDLPADDGGLVERFQKALSREHSTAAASVDTSLFNPSRIIRLPGSWNRKADSIPTRPHRLVKVLSAPEGLPAIVTREQMEDVIAAYPEELASMTPPAKGTSTSMKKLKVTSDPVARCRAYLARVPPAIEGEHGSDRTFQAARIVWNDFNLNEADGWPLLCEWNCSCNPPWDEENGNQSLRRKWNEAVAKGPCEKGRGWRLKPDVESSPDADAKIIGDYPVPRPGENWNDPHRLARLFADRLRHGQYATLVQWRDEFHQWDGASWSPKPNSDLDAEIARHCHRVFEADFPKRVAEAQANESIKMPSIYAVSAAVKTNVRVNLAGMLNRPDTGAEPPFWLDGEGPNAENVIAAPNGLFTLSGIAKGEGPFSPPTPRFFTPNAVAFNIDVHAPAPVTWLRCLEQWFSGDAASIAGLQEWFAYALSGRTAAHKILLLVGPRRSGKGTILRVLTDLIGVANIASTTFTALGENFGLENLLGKRIAMIPDARLSGRSDTAAIVERLLSVSGEDPQSVNRKNRPRITTRLRTRFIVATNELPRLPDASGALESRFHILHTPTSWLGREDLNLGEKLAAELPGILKWAAEGWERLVSNRLRFTPNTAAEQYHRDLADLSSPVRAFVRQCCTIGPEFETEIPTLYASWVRWNEQRKREVGAENMFGKEIRAAFPHLRVTQTRSDLGIRVRTYAGIGLKCDADWGEEDEPARTDTRDDSTYAMAKSELADSGYIRLCLKTVVRPACQPVPCLSPLPLRWATVGAGRRRCRSPAESAGNATPRRRREGK